MFAERRDMAEPKNTGKFGKGNPGKPKGATSKITKEVKTMVLEALDGAGGVGYLIERATDPRTASAFLSLVGKVIPLQVQGADDPNAPAVKHHLTIDFVDAGSVPKQT
jgi:hypothetical protein